MHNDDFPAALSHGVFREIFPDIFMVSGEMKMSGKPMSFSRNMVVIREHGSLTLINTLRLDEYGLKALEALGSIEHVIRLAGFHGRDDAFYNAKYGAKVHAIRGQSYVAGFDLTASPYFEADEWIDGTSELPVSGARLYLFKSCTPPEAVLILLRDGGILISGDALQNWQAADRYFNLMARVMMRVAGFIHPFAVGPGWKKFAKPAPGDLRGLLDIRFDHVLPAHGDEVIGDALNKYRPAIEKAASDA